MYNITVISTMHVNLGKCNAGELYQIISGISPDVIFLEAFESSYSSYDKLLPHFGIYNKKLEVHALQLYHQEKQFKYVPVLNNGLSKAFDEKYELISKNIRWQTLLEQFNELASKKGFEFLNSTEAITLQEEMRKLEKQLLEGNKILSLVELEIDEYEEAMIKNIYTYCEENVLDAAVFMCGVAHRKSIKKKIADYVSPQKLNWTFMETFKVKTYE